MKTMTVRETVKALGYSRQYIYNLLVEEKLPAKKVEGEWQISAEAVRKRASAKKVLRG
jgi:excisionase family DNA binding protein